MKATPFRAPLSRPPLPPPPAAAPVAQRGHCWLHFLRHHLGGFLTVAAAPQPSSWSSKRRHFAAAQSAKSCITRGCGQQLLQLVLQAAAIEVGMPLPIIHRFLRPSCLHIGTLSPTWRTAAGERFPICCRSAHKTHTSVEKKCGPMVRSSKWPQAAVALAAAASNHLPHKFRLSCTKQH